MRILYLAHRIPFPPNKGDKIRSFHEIKHFSRNHEIHLAAFYDRPEDACYAGGLDQYCASVRLVPLNRQIQLSRAGISLLRGRPWSTGYFDHPEMAELAAHDRTSTRFDLVFGYSSSMAPYLMKIGLPKILDFVDSDALKWGQYSRARSFPFSFLYGYEARHLAAFERLVAGSMDFSVFVSEREARHLTPGERLQFVQNGIDLDYWCPCPGAPTSTDIIFTGAMDYFPNIDAVTFFARDVFPQVRARVPDACFVIVGANPAPAVRRLGEVSGVRIAGGVPDTRLYLYQSRVAVAPMRISQGIQNKILEALATGLRVVATPAVVNGMEGVSDLPVSVAADPGAMADAIVESLRAPLLSKSEVDRTRAVLATHYDWETNLSKFDLLFDRAVRVHP